MTVFSISGIVYVCLKFGSGSCTLIKLLSLVTVYTADQLWLFYSLTVDGKYLAESFALCALSEPLVHLYICVIYLKVAIEVTYLLDKNIYLENQIILREFAKKKQRLNCFFAVNLVLCFSLGVITWLGYTHDSLGSLSFASDILFIVFQVAYLVIWALALYSLYRDIQQAKTILPNRRIFLLHASLLVLYLLGVAGDTILSYMPKWLGCGESCFYKYRSMGQISIVIGNYAESATFLLVVYVMAPVTKKQQLQQLSFKNYLLNGIVELDKIEPAVMAANPNLTPFEREFL